MKQIRIFAVMMMLTLSAVVMAQTTVKGVLKDQALDESEPFATVRVFKAGQTDKPVAMFLTKGDRLLQVFLTYAAEHDVELTLALHFL